MFSSNKSGARRAEVRKKRPDTAAKLFKELQADGGLVSLWVAAVFAVVAIGILSMRADVVHYRPGQYAQHDISSRVDFVFFDQDKLNREKDRAREETPHIYATAATDPWKTIEQRLLALPDQLANIKLDEIGDETLKKTLDEPSLALIQDARTPAERGPYERAVHDYMSAVRKLDLVVLNPTDRENEVKLASQDLNRAIVIPGDGSIRPNITYSVNQKEILTGKFADAADKNFKLALVPKIAALTSAWLTPTHELDDAQTNACRTRPATWRTKPT